MPLRTARSREAPTSWSSRRSPLAAPSYIRPTSSCTSSTKPERGALSDAKLDNDDTVRNDDAICLIMPIPTLVRANEESAMKSRRLKASWDGGDGEDRTLDDMGPAVAELRARRA